MINDQQYLSQEESMEVEMALLTSQEKFLTRLTISSLRLLKIIAADLQVEISQLTPQQIITWMEKDSKIRREEGIDKAVLKWE
ncbi:hypothetical protein Cyast_1591 [Cyanobacterium stanieri PCC 7202]|uniref:Uncharacterized protein n=1 Tax=Cyanobacterium stanieri (strain ATCC 29140 / PCC 7202) TaxID=292563 RepID=K9YM41_CYASC|nr:hypothetical protein Cyast_1591 [Cyanobacterium stanieri PCC 7202]